MTTWLLAPLTRGLDLHEQQREVKACKKSIHRYFFSESCTSRQLRHAKAVERKFYLYCWCCFVCPNCSITLLCRKLSCAKIRKVLNKNCHHAFAGADYEPSFKFNRIGENRDPVFREHSPLKFGHLGSEATLQFNSLCRPFRYFKSYLAALTSAY